MIDTFREAGVQLYALAVDGPKDAARVVKGQDLPFPILCDTAKQVCRTYGLLHSDAGPGGDDIAHPAHLLIDGDGIVRWRYVSGRVQDRPTPDEIREQLRRFARAG